MRVGMNAVFLDPGRSGGPETYLRQLLPALAAEFPDVELEVATTRRGAPALADSGATVHRLEADEGERLRRLHAEQLLVPRLARERGWDVIHSLANTAPLRPGRPSVLTLHDVIFFRHRTMSLVSTLAHRLVAGPAARRADVIVAVSQAARDEIVDELHVDAGRFVVAPHGPGREPVEPAPLDEVRQRFALGGRRVVLCVAAKRPHKNQALLVRAVGELGHSWVAVLAGHPEAYDRELRALAADLGVEDRIRFADYVPDPELEALWRIADCAAFPTLTEGFGLPVLEAMRRGVAVACSDIAVLREVGGDVPRYFDPRDPAAAARAIEAATSDTRAAAAGPARAGEFTWQRSARAHMEAYRRACT